MNNDLNNYKLLIRNYGGQRQWNMFKMLIEKTSTRIPYPAKIFFHKDIFHMKENRICCQKIDHKYEGSDFQTEAVQVVTQLLQK